MTRPRAAERRLRATYPLARGRPVLGYGIVVLASAIGGVNANVGKVVLVSGGLSPHGLAELRATASAGLLLVGIALLARGRFTPMRRELPFLVAFGVFGLALAQYFYFFSIERLDVGAALLIVNLAIVLVALWGRLSGHEQIEPRLWAAILLALVGLAFVVEVWNGIALDGLGVVAALVGALTYAIYVVMADRSAREARPAWFLVAWGFFFAGVFWAVAQPWWSFPFELLNDEVSLLGRVGDVSAPVWALLAYIVPLGTVGTFVLYAAALRYIPPTHVVVVAVLEPVFGTLVAFAWLGEALAPLQLAGGALVIAAVLLGQSARAAGSRLRAEPLSSPADGVEPAAHLGDR